MSLATGTARHSSRQPMVARGAGLLIAVLTAVFAVLLAMPGSWSARLAGQDTRTVYPLMLLPAIAIAFAAGITAACRPGAARVAAVISALMSVQLAGIALVASRDWLNWGGAGLVTDEGEYAGARLAETMAVVAGAAIVAGVALYRCGPGRRPAPVVHRGWVCAGAAVFVAVPLLLCEALHRSGLTAVGQFALWWSLPWGLGLVAAGTLHTAAARRAALLCVVASVILTVVCVGVSPRYGFGLSLPS